MESECWIDIQFVFVLLWNLHVVDLLPLFFLCRRVKGLKGKAAWDYQRSKSASSMASTSHSPTPSPVVSPSPIPNRDIHDLILDSELGQTSQSAPHTPTQENKLTPNSNSEQSDLDFSSALRLSTPNLNVISSTPTSEESCQLGSQIRDRTTAIGRSSPLSQRRAKSTSSLQKGTATSSREVDMSKEKRYSAIFATLR